MSSTTQDDNSNYQAFFENAPATLLIIDKKNHVILDANNRALELFGTAKGEFVGLKIDEVFPDSEAIIDYIGNLESDSNKNNMKTHFARKDGPREDVFVTGSIIKVHNHKIVELAISEIPGRADERKDDFVNRVNNTATVNKRNAFKKVINPALIKRLEVVCDGFIIYSVTKELLSDQKIKIDYTQFPDKYDPLHSLSQGYDFIVFALPNLTNYELGILKDLCKKDRKLPILVLCLRSDDETISTLIRLGIRGIITEERDFHLLPAAINAIVEGELWFPRSIITQLLKDSSSISMNGAKKQGWLSILSNRETEILKLMAAGLKNQEIADELYISYSTVATHANNIFRKLDLSSRAEAIRFAIEEKLI